MRGFNKFYSELKNFLETQQLEAEYLTSLFLFIRHIFDEEIVAGDEGLARELREIEILAVNQVNKNFDKAKLIDLAFAFKIAAEGKDQVFKYKFSKKVASRIALIDVDRHPKLSLRCLLHIVSCFSSSGYVGQEAWNVIQQLIHRHANDSRLPLSFEEIETFILLAFEAKILSPILLDTLLKDLLIAVEGSKLNYTQLYDIIYLLYATKTPVPYLINILLDYYVQRGYDEDELSLLGNSKACKFLKAVSEMQPNPRTQFSDLFLEASYKFIKKHHNDFTTMQLKRAVEYLKEMQYFKDLQDEEMLKGIREVKTAFEGRIAHAAAKHHGLDLMMKAEETTLSAADVEDEDPVFEEDLSDEEEKVNQRPKSGKDVINSLKNNDPILNIFRQASKEDIPKRAPPAPELDAEFYDPRLKRVSDMIDESYKKHGSKRPK